MWRYSEHIIFLGHVSHLLPPCVRKSTFFPLHCMFVEINFMHVVCIINKTVYFKRLTIKGLQVSFYQNCNFGTWS